MQGFAPTLANKPIIAAGAMRLKSRAVDERGRRSPAVLPRQAEARAISFVPVGIRMDVAVVEALAAINLLDPADKDNRVAIGAALSELIQRLVNSDV